MTLENLTVFELKQRLRARKLSTAGTKAQLIRRLRQSTYTRKRPTGKKCQGQIPISLGLGADTFVDCDEDVEDADEDLCPECQARYLEEIYDAIKND